MATITTITEVTPGDLITAELMNQILQRLAALEGKIIVIPTGNVTVPTVVGQKLFAARATIIAPSSQLNMGFVIDASGKSIDVASVDTRDLIVLNEVPPGGSKVPPGTAIDLVVAATGTGGTTQPHPPKISTFAPLKVPIGQEVQIVGESFALSRLQNSVTFNEVPAAPPSSASTTTSLVVIVPSGIPGAPANPGQELTVVVKVVTPDGTTTSNLTVLPPLAGGNPKINSITPPFLVTGQTATIIGEGFFQPFDRNIVKFSTPTSPAVSVTPSAGSATQLTVLIPTNIVGLTAPGTVGSVNVVVRATERDSVAFAAPIQVPTQFPTQ
ncbi:MAG TPA: IPT/TIG domain-containing protein [Thermoanaerobaculia bacterium]|jgi:hypothetical protein|nr:IPT/TIG domain-containing protein [Thermoanaerobaculia bacterium]